MPLPALANWDPTRTALHQAAQVVGAIRKVDAAPLPNYLQLALEVVPQGVTSGPLAPSIGGELVLNFAERAIVYTSPDRLTIDTVPLEGLTQVTLLDAVLMVMEKSGHPVQVDRSKITGQEALQVHPDAAHEYNEALFKIYLGFARFKARLFGPMSRMVVWPHGFDLSFLWFTHGLDESNDPHMNFGFSPGSPGFARPYVYAYAHPKPPGMFDVELPQGARWNTDPWTGIALDYDALAVEADIESVIEKSLLQIHTAISPLMG
jgi:hypothetical protein